MPAALLIENLVFTYGGSGAASSSFRLSVPKLQLDAGEGVLLSGGSGRGKSTLLHLVAGLMDPQEGTIRVGGEPITAMHGAARDLFRGRRIGMIFQTFNLLPGFSALENVMLALMAAGAKAAAQKKRAEELLSQLGIERTHAAPEELSVGQQQRVAVARAIACRPALVLADEPTASLDPENGAAAMDLIQEACRSAGAALLCTSHDPALRSRFTRVESIEAFLGGGASAGSGARGGSPGGAA